MTHTETPWTADNVVFKGLTLIMNASDKIVKQAELDTEYMFKCVNEHDTLTKRVAELEEAMRDVKDVCLCKRSTKGFDYGEKHPHMGKARVGARWMTPIDIAEQALKKGESDDNK